MFVGLFAFDTGLSPYVQFPKYPSHVYSFTQNISCFPSQTSICYMAARTGSGLIYRYDTNDATKLDVGFLSNPIAISYIHPKLDYGFSATMTKVWITFLINSQGQSTLTICPDRDPTIGQSYGGIMLPDDPVFISSTDIHRLNIIDYISYSFVDIVTIP